MKKKSRNSSIKQKSKTPASSGETDSKAQWAVLQGEECHWPGAPLLALLLEASYTRGLSLHDLAEHHLGITHSHFLLLRKGQRSIPRLGEEVMNKIAKFLGLPKVVVMLAGGQLKLEDFYQNPEVLDSFLAPALQFIQKDPELGPYMPPSAFVADEALRRFIVLLYEKASGKLLLPSRATLKNIEESFKTIAPDS